MAYPFLDPQRWDAYLQWLSSIQHRPPRVHPERDQHDWDVRFFDLVFDNFGHPDEWLDVFDVMLQECDTTFLFVGSEGVLYVEFPKEGNE